jgi:hypothetical protein
VPLGYRPEPDLGEKILSGVIGLQEGETALLETGGVELIGAEAFRPLSRAAARLAAQELSR